MTQRKLTLLALSLAALVAMGPDAAAQRGRESSRPSSGSSSGVRSSPSRPSVPSSRPSVPSSGGSVRSAPVRPSGGSSSASGGSSSRGTVIIPRSSGSSARGADSSSRSSGSSRVISVPSGPSSSSRSSSSGATYTRPSSIPSSGTWGSPSDRGSSFTTGGSSGASGSSSGSSSSRGLSSRGSTPSSESASGGSASSADSNVIYSAPRRVGFPAPATPSNTAPSDGRGASSSSRGVTGLRSSGGPSSSRFGLDRATDRSSRSVGLSEGRATRIGQDPSSRGASSRSSGPSSLRDAYGRSSSGGSSSASGPSTRLGGPERGGGDAGLDRTGLDRTGGIVDRYGRGPGERGGDTERGVPSAGRVAERGRERDAGAVSRGGGVRSPIDTARGRSSLTERTERRTERGERGLGSRDVPRERTGAENLGRPRNDGRIGGLEDTGRLARLAGADPGRSQEVGRLARRASELTGRALHTGFRASLGLVGCGGLGFGYWDNGWGFWGGYGYGHSYWSSYGYWWGLGCYPYSYWSHPFSYPYYCYYGAWPRVRYWYPSYYYPLYYSYPAYTASVITRYVYDDYDSGGDTIVYLDDGEGGDVYVESTQPEQQVYAQGEAVAAEPPATGGVGDGSFPAAADEAAQDEGERATGQYLTLGDQAFRDGRFADAVHFYARAVQFTPENGVLWLVLSDGLFATGDYHYGAFALRKALALDPGLAHSPVDKRTFYSDGSEFDRQVAVLEGFVQDHPGDTDARLMLAANYLFGGRPAAAVDLIEAPGAETLRADASAAVVLEAARAVQYGR